MIVVVRQYGAGKVSEHRILSTLREISGLKAIRRGIEDNLAKARARMEKLV